MEIRRPRPQPLSTLLRGGLDQLAHTLISPGRAWPEATPHLAAEGISTRRFGQYPAAESGHLATGSVAEVVPFHPDAGPALPSLEQ
jgi:hypothetical protein